MAVLEDIFGGNINYVALVHDEERGIYVNTDETEISILLDINVSQSSTVEYLLDRESDVAFYTTFDSLKQDVLL